MWPHVIVRLLNAAVECGGRVCVNDGDVCVYGLYMSVNDVYMTDSM